jgi:hypothetical protein
MNRRESIKIIPLLGIASVWLTSCGSNYVEGYKHLKLTAEDLKIIDAIRKSIIPIEDKSKDAEYSSFVLKYADEIISTAKRNIFTSGFQELKHKLKGELAYSTVDITAGNISDFWSAASKSSNLIEGFLNILKQGTVQYYKTEEQYVVGKLGYKLVPGEFQSCVKIGS